jgi:hypothetical protein
MDLIISGRSEGLAAASAINDFLSGEGTATCVLQTHMKLLPAYDGCMGLGDAANPTGKGAAVG